MSTLEDFITKQFGFRDDYITVDGSPDLITKEMYQFALRKSCEMNIRKFGAELSQYSTMSSSALMDMTSMLIDDDDIEFFKVSFTHYLDEDQSCDLCVDKELDEDTSSCSHHNKFNMYYAVYGGFKPFYAFFAPTVTAMEHHELELIMKSKDLIKPMRRKSI